jgi:hypothetical protein
MGLIKRGDIAPPAELAREVVAVAALGGEVVVVELDLSARLEFEAALAEQRQADPGKLVWLMLPRLLALCVRDADDQPLFTVDEWRRFGARHRGAAVDLFNAGMRLSGLDAAESAKN